MGRFDLTPATPGPRKRTYDEQRADERSKAAGMRRQKAGPNAVEKKARSQFRRGIISREERDIRMLKGRPS